jgi:CheY-like chemotaxis protein
MKVLFVDDEPKVLEGLERVLFHLGDEWEMTFVESGREAVAELERGPFEAIVTDMRMPGMDGAELLQVVHRRWPETVRIVLSGYAEMESALRTIPVAHQFLSKPCRPEVIEDAVLRSRGLQALLGDPGLRRAVGQVQKLPSVPAVYARLSRPPTTRTPTWPTWRASWNGIRPCARRSCSWSTQPSSAAADVAATSRRRSCGSACR